ncbi:MAG: response regulator [Desulfocapsaceae bacterium]|nr:response regulator [Desulfocapsaceae bacterium]
MNELVYVVDDDTDLRESITEILSEEGFAVRSFAGAETALAGFDTAIPQIAIVDYMMPGMDGMTLIFMIKKKYPRLKVIMITAFSTVENAVAAMKGGADDYLPKPFKKNDLLTAVRRNLEEIRFEQEIEGPGMDEILACLANQIRRQILKALHTHGKMRFMDITRDLGATDHTKVNFHLKNLKIHKLISQDRDKLYTLSSQGKKMIEYLSLLSKKLQ